MKKTLVIALAVALFATVKTQAQGYFAFSNVGATLDAPIYDVGGTTLLSGGLADFVYGSSAASLSKGNTTLTSPVAVNSGYFLGNKQVLNDFAGTSTVFVQVRAWKSSGGATYEAAKAANGPTGASSVFQVTLAGAPSTPVALNSLTSFSLVATPEPTTVALGALGLSVLLFRRRK